MSPRFEQLRRAIANLGASADLQDQYLTTHGFTAEYGNDELALEFDGIFPAAADMMLTGELTPLQLEAAQSVNDLLDQWSGTQHADFWKRGALWSDARWEDIRGAANKALLVYES